MSDTEDPFDRALLDKIVNIILIGMVCLTIVVLFKTATNTTRPAQAPCVCECPLVEKEK